MTGLKEFNKLISERSFRARVNKVMKDYVKKVVSDAKSKAPTTITFVDRGVQTNNIPYTQSTNVGASIYGTYKNEEVILEVLDPQAPYIEFGTGDFAFDQVSQYEKEWQDLAWSYYKTGTGTLMSSPFMHPAVTENYQMIPQKLVEALND